MFLLMCIVLRKDRHMNMKFVLGLAILVLEFIKQFYEGKEGGENKQKEV